MGSSENFCLRWNDFESNVSASFRELRAEADLFDVSVLADADHDSQHLGESRPRPLRAHKVILSACSAFFKHVLRAQTYAHAAQPIIYLRGVRMKDLEAILDFMYHGEVNVAQDDLNSFLAVAEDLQVKGLTQTTSATPGHFTASSSSTKRTISSKRSASMQGTTAKRVRSEDVSVKSEPDGGGGTIAPAGGGDASVEVDDPVASTSGAVQERDSFAESEEAGVIGEYDDGFTYGDDSIMTEEGAGMEQQDSTKGHAGSDISSAAQVLPFGQGRCTICNKVFKSVQSARRHVQAFHTHQKRIECCFCKRILRNVFVFRSHINSIHNVTGVRDLLANYGKVLEDDDDED